jgi:hypothetical protein
MYYFSTKQLIIEIIISQRQKSRRYENIQYMCRNLCGCIIYVVNGNNVRVKILFLNRKGWQAAMWLHEKNTFVNTNAEHSV